MAQIIVDPEQHERDRQAAFKAADDAEAGNQPQGGTEDELPEKYRGKSLQEVIDMHRNAESELGRKNNEIGMVRKLADELIGVRTLDAQARANQQAAERKPLTTDQLLDNPEEAIVGVVQREAAARTQSLEQRTAELESELMVERFEKRHPGFQTTMQTQEFGAFVQGSNYRRKLAVAAAKGDFDAADELFGLYEEAKPAQQQAKQNDGVVQARQASLAKSGGSSASGVIPSGDGKKIFTRAELMEMRIKRPDEFDMRQEEILQAYREKRVR